MTFRPGVVLIAPLLTALALSIVLFVVSPGFSILVVLTSIAMIPGAALAYFGFTALMRR